MCCSLLVLSVSDRCISNIGLHYSSRDLQYYTLRVKKTGPFSFEHNFHKYCPILIFFHCCKQKLSAHKHIIEFLTLLIVCCCTSLPRTIQLHMLLHKKLLNKSAMHAVISLLLQSRKFWWYLLLTSWMPLHDVIMTSHCCQRYAECLLTTLCSAWQCTATPRHARATVELQRQETPNFLASKMWLPNSPDLSPEDNEIWGPIFEKSLEDLRKILGSS